MVLTMIVTKSDDGFTAEVPSLKGCESWAHDEATVIDKTLDLVAYYLKLDMAHFVMDKMRRSGNNTYFQIGFNKK